MQLAGRNDKEFELSANMTNQKMQFIYVFEAIRPEMLTNPEAWTEEDNQIASNHFSYLKQGARDGIVILAGRSQDGIGPAIVIIEVETQEAAMRFMQNDPFVKQCLMRAHLHPYRVALSRKANI